MSDPRILGFDVGAINMGWACVERSTDSYKLLGYGVLGVTPLPKETFRDYRWRLIDYWVDTFPTLVVKYEPSLFASETIPIVNHGGKFGNLQRVKGLVAVSVCQALAIERYPDLKWNEYGANTVKSRVTGNDKATKVGVRNAVCKVFPEIEPIKKALEPDETDAIAVALCGSGYGQ